MPQWGNYGNVNPYDYPAGAQNPTQQMSSLGGMAGAGVRKEMDDVLAEQKKGQNGWNSMREGAKIAGLGQAMDPYSGIARMQGIVNQDPRMNQMWGGYQGALGGMNADMGAARGAASGFNQQMQSMYQPALKSARRDYFGGMAENRAGNQMQLAMDAQRQNAQGDILRNAAMQSGSGANRTAMGRQAIMQSSMLGAQMAPSAAAQVAGAKMQARNQAYQNYLGALSAKQGGMQAGMGGLATTAGLGQQGAGVYGQAYGSARDTLGGAIGAAGNIYGQQQTALPNYYG